MRFRPSQPLTLGIELELQLIDSCSGDLCDRAAELIGGVPGLSSEITQAMVEYNSPVCENAAQLSATLIRARDEIIGAAARIGLGVCGGGLHPFHGWPDRKISPGERFDFIHQRYAYLAQTFTVFGQHIHVGCQSGHDALYLTHALAPYIPHFIALAATSPFYRGVDTQYDCARLNVLTAFPTSGTAPWIHDWNEFETHLLRLQELRVVESMKDLYWDVRPKADTGTVEIRVCDTPLTVLEAADLAVYAQLLSYELLGARHSLSEEVYIPYRSNRFQACRYGFNGVVTDFRSGASESIRSNVLRTLERLWPLAQALDCTATISRLGVSAESGQNGAAWLRHLVAEGATQSEMVMAQSVLWAGQWPDP